MMKPMFTNADIDRWFEVFEEKVEAKTITILKDSGEYFVKLARESKTYRDDTNNLRSSIGYVIVKDGAILIEDFKISGTGTGSDGAEGLAKGKMLAVSIASKVNGIALVCVAGMNYAVHVENNGYEVISSSTLQTEMWLRKSIKLILNTAARNQANF